MTAAHRTLLVAAGLVVAAIALGSLIARTFFGLSHEGMLVGLSIAFAAMFGLGLLANRLVHGVWIKRPTAEERAAVQADMRRVRRAMVLGTVVLLPIALGLVFLGFPEVATKITSPIVIAAIIAGAVLTGKRRRSV